jgi:hypothetical protein
MKLTVEQKIFILKAVAHYDGPAKVVVNFKEAYGVELARSHVQMYDPHTNAGRKLPGRWRDMFFEFRKKFIEDASTIGVAQKTFRLRTLDDMLRQTANPRTKLQILEAAAREAADYHRRPNPEGGIPADGILKIQITGGLPDDLPDGPAIDLPDDQE